MAAEVFTHIETATLRPGATAMRVITGAGIYSVAPDSPVATALMDEGSRWRRERIYLYLAIDGGSSRIVGLASQGPDRVTIGRVAG